MPTINTYATASYAVRSRTQNKTSLPDQYQEAAKVTSTSSDDLDSLIKKKKELIEGFKTVHFDQFLQLEDRERFNAELKKEKKIKLIGSVIAFIIPILIITALSLFAPAIIPTLSYFIAKCIAIVGPQVGLGLLCATLVLTPVLYLGLISGMRKAIKFILGKDIFSEKQETESLGKKLYYKEKQLQQLEIIKERQKESSSTPRADSALPSVDSAPIVNAAPMIDSAVASSSAALSTDSVTLSADSAPIINVDLITDSITAPMVGSPVSFPAVSIFGKPIKGTLPTEKIVSTLVFQNQQDQSNQSSIKRKEGTIVTDNTPNTSSIKPK